MYRPPFFTQILFVAENILLEEKRFNYVGKEAKEACKRFSLKPANDCRNKIIRLESWPSSTIKKMS